MPKPVTSSVRFTRTKGGMSVRATGAAAQALFDAMTKAQATPAQQPPKPPKEKDRA